MKQISIKRCLSSFIRNEMRNKISMKLNDRFGASKFGNVLILNQFA